MNIEIFDVHCTVDHIVADYSIESTRTLRKLEHDEYRDWLSENEYQTDLNDTCRNGEHNQSETEIGYVDFILSDRRREKAMATYLADVIHAPLEMAY